MKVKAGLAKAILEEDFAAATVWVVNLHKFVILYGLNFSKEDHVYLIKVKLTKKLEASCFFKHRTMTYYFSRFCLDSLSQRIFNQTYWTSLQRYFMCK